MLYRLSLIRNVLRIYSTGLTPPPTHPKTEVLVRLAHQTLKEARPTAVAALQDPTDTVEIKTNFVIEDYDELLFHTDARQLTFSGRQRRERFQTALNDHNSDRKPSRRGAKMNLKICNEQQFGEDEMCASCHVLESKLGVVTYCSRECQKQHWNKAHKKECAGRKQY
jgi:hypothetical protein